ncbi:CBO0543 family protein [Clostridium kluyveri]|uniref:Uncharacterized protein n=2 Tax=Clostridium kluyveri TaxID=1534 RepID=A5N150_CLOK5|nr:CBO0543 family protein [Clostridium kluyveri]EDK34846.1 Conserved hypothetical protein [Clostridium kluyveri DSM 555]BAH07573.1 hypothetical protein CKR_2522 [Clostridium kluyveri NBRC 12016]
MLLNITIGLIIPWITGIFLYFKEKELLLITFPFASSIALVINAWGFNRDYWNLYPFECQHISDLPFDIGLYPIMGVYMLYFIRHTKLKSYFIISSTILFTTFLEFLGVFTGRVFYSKGWNILYTFFSYVFSYIVLYYFYLYLKKLKILR